MTPGALMLRLRQRFEHGLHTAWCRDVIRHRILRTAPVTGTGDTRCEIHVLTSAADWLNLVWTLKSFYAASGRRYALCIHEDGSLGESAVGTLRSQFPAARIVRRKEADERVLAELKEFPRSLALRRTNALALKVFDFRIYLEADRMALFDSDLLFFNEPTAFLERMEADSFTVNAFNGDVASAYTVDPHDVRERLGFSLVPRVNSGFGIVHRSALRWDWTEEFLELPGILDGHPWRIEQTLYALCASRAGAELLPDEYSVTLTGRSGARPFRHYVGAIRHLMYSEGMARLAREGLLAA